MKTIIKAAAFHLDDDVLAMQMDRLKRLEADFETVKSVLEEFGYEHMTKDKTIKD